MRRPPPSHRKPSATSGTGAAGGGGGPRPIRRAVVPAARRGRTACRTVPPGRSTRTPDATSPPGPVRRTGRHATFGSGGRSRSPQTMGTGPAVARGASTSTEPPKSCAHRSVRSAIGHLAMHANGRRAAAAVPRSSKRRAADGVYGVFRLGVGLETSFGTLVQRRSAGFSLHHSLPVRASENQA